MPLLLSPLILSEARDINASVAVFLILCVSLKEISGWHGDRGVCWPLMYQSETAFQKMLISLEFY